MTDRERKAAIRDTLIEVASIFDEYQQAELLRKRAAELDDEINPECTCGHEYDSHLPPCPMAGTYGWGRI